MDATRSKLDCQKRFHSLFTKSYNLNVGLDMLSTCSLCSNQNPVIGIDGTRYNLSRRCCADGTIWATVGLDDQDAVWNIEDETSQANDFEVFPFSFF